MNESERSMTYLGLGVEELTQKGALHTAREIAQQPVLWQKIYAQVKHEKAALQDFFRVVNGAGVKRIILTGAGTSAFIGMSLRGSFQRATNLLTEAIATTDLVSHPADYFKDDTPTLLVSFARSGNSPESVAAVKIADAFCAVCHHLIITCNEAGQLAQYETQHSKYTFVLPAEANDQSLAMTSSYSGMLLAGRLMAAPEDIADAAAQVQLVKAYAERILNSAIPALQQLAALDFKRAVFLGAGPFLGTATEAHLKLQELTDGRVICKNDSYLGLRHGPKAVIDDTTLVVYLFSNSPYPLQYEKDLAAAVKKGPHPLATVAVAESAVAGVHADYSFIFSDGEPRLEEDFLTVCSIVPAQLLAFFKSLQLGFQPDTPSATGAITRVVQGVQIYEVQKPSSVIS